MTTDEVAEELGYHIEGVRMMLRAGRLKARKYGRMWLVDPDSVREFKAWIEARGLSKHDPRRGQPD